jgi:hypothetical protein
MGSAAHKPIIVVGLTLAVNNVEATILPYLLNVSGQADASDVLYLFSSLRLALMIQNGCINGRQQGLCLVVAVLAISSACLPQIQSASV